MVADPIFIFHKKWWLTPFQPFQHFSISSISPFHISHFIVKKKFGVKFSEESFWSEPFKSFKNLDNLMPFLLVEDVKGKEEILNEIKTYFTENSKKFLNKQFK